jgi:hypothetical protein
MASLDCALSMYFRLGERRTISQNSSAHRGYMGLVISLSVELGEGNMSVTFKS